MHLWKCNPYAARNREGWQKVTGFFLKLTSFAPATSWPIHSEHCADRFRKIGLGVAAASLNTRSVNQNLHCLLFVAYLVKRHLLYTRQAICPHKTVDRKLSAVYPHPTVNNSTSLTTMKNYAPLLSGAVTALFFLIILPSSLASTIAGVILLIAIACFDSSPS